MAHNINFEERGKGRLQRKESERKAITTRSGKNSYQKFAWELRRTKEKRPKPRGSVKGGCRKEKGGKIAEKEPTTTWQSITSKQVDFAGETRKP